MSMWVRGVLLSLALAVLAGCGDGSDLTDVTPRGPASPGLDVATMVSCDGQVAWPASAMTDRLPNDQSPDLLAALVEFSSDPGPDLPPLLRDGRVGDEDWFVLARDGHGAAVATGPWNAEGPGKGAQVMYLDNEGGWKVTGWGDCGRLRRFTDDGQAVQIAGVDGTRDTTTPTLLVNEVACTSGRDPRPFLREPHVVETDDYVVITWASDPTDGTSSHSCIGNSPVPVALTLQAPLGDRVLYDGSQYPPKKVG